MDRAQASRPNGFTLVELLISISLLAILIGLTLPALTNVNLEGKLTRMKLMQRQLSIATFQYTEDHAATFPYFATPRDPYGPVVIGGITFTDGPPYFKRPVSDWATALVPSYIPSASSIEHPSMRDILAREGHPSLVRAQSAISASVFADPAFFTNEARHRPMEEAHFRATRTFEVRFPSDKGLLTTWGAPGARPYAAVFETAGFPITFADGATIAWQRGRITSLPSVDVPWLGNIQIHTTPNGIAGRDRALPTPH
ncbi:MAG: type II secretion system protein [Planctomycetota bacterium]|nr:MAG: type II secretion system protein [Planctomycetota bacterium]